MEGAYRVPEDAEKGIGRGKDVLSAWRPEKTAMWELGQMNEREVSTGRRGGDFF